MKKFKKWLDKVFLRGKYKISQPDDDDRQIEELTQNPDSINIHWYNARGLFKYAGDNRDSFTIGCLTMIRSNESRTACTPELTAAIRADERLPLHMSDITIAHLPVFAEWQRKIDAAMASKWTFYGRNNARANLPEAK